MIWTMRPTLPFVLSPAAGRVGLAAAVAAIVYSIGQWWFIQAGNRSRASALQRRGAAHDFSDLLRDLGLALAVEGPGQELDQLTGIVGGVFHRRAPRAVFRRRGLDQSLVDHVAHVERQQLGENRFGAGCEDVVRPTRPGPRLFTPTRAGLDRENASSGRRGRQRALKAGVHQVHAGNLAAFVRGDDAGPYLYRMIRRRLVADIKALTCELPTGILEVPRPFLAHRVEI